MKLLPVLYSAIVVVGADIYLHNPRGSNNRLHEEGRGRANGNRLFDSQNNERGGYNVGSVYYHVGSKLQIEWTNQHSCGNAYSHCEIILQYMCSDLVRDGATTKIPPADPKDCYHNNCDTDLEFGHHEDHGYYAHCWLRYRNMGLFTADQKVKRDRATFTRQNPNGVRRGYECAEERDYYPYWQSSPWKDIAIMTNDVKRCPYYQAESQNVKSRWYCEIPQDALLANIGNHKFMIPTNQWDCEAFRYPKESANATKGVWTEVPAHGIGPPDCMESPYTRDNYLGNTFGGYMPNYNWTVPNDIGENCVMRIRYNVSTADYNAWDAVDSSNNQVARNKGVDVGLHEKHGFASKTEADERGFKFETDPRVAVFPGLGSFKLRLAVNTAQFGRTFQDRSHTFAIRERPDHIHKKAIIHNVNVRGKRGNIVQVYPAVEYDFVPNTLELAKNDYIHFQWTGSNTNPPGNDGEGVRGSDRSNIILQSVEVYTEGTGRAYEFDKYGHWGRSYPQSIQNQSLLGFSVEEMETLALLSNTKQFRGSLAQLNDVGTYFDMGPLQAKDTGTCHYMSTRNNNFSNRSQKGRLVCRPYLVEQKSIGWNGGTFELSNGDAKLTVGRGVFASHKNLRMEQWTEEQGRVKVKAKDRSLPSGGDVAGRYLIIHPEEPLTVEGQSITVEMKIDYGGIEDVKVYRSDTNFFSTWSTVDADISDGTATFQATKGGVYVAKVESNIGVIIGAVVGCLVVVALVIVGTVWYCRKYPSKFSNVKRSLKPRI